MSAPPVTWQLLLHTSRQSALNGSHSRCDVGLNVTALFGQVKLLQASMAAEE